MYIRYDIPIHLESFLEDLPAEKVCSIITLMLELAVNKGLINYPTSYVEANIKDMREDILQLIQSNKLHNSSIEQNLTTYTSNISSTVAEQLTSHQENLTSQLTVQNENLANQLSVLTNLITSQMNNPNVVTLPHFSPSIPPMSSASLDEVDLTLEELDGEEEEELDDDELLLELLEGSTL